jgi:beta-glucosidase
LGGKVNPSGKLATTFAMNYKDEPSAKNFPGTPDKKPEQVIYEEGVYVGYRYFDAFKVQPAYEFGYGLSYTKFKISDVKVSSPNFTGSITVKVTVKNTGPVAGKEVVQLYLSAPAKSMDKPENELKAFAKTMLLAPGQSQFMIFTLHTSDLASFNTAQSAWVADAGEYKVKVGSSSRQIKGTATFNLPRAVVTERVHKALEPQVTIAELKNQ